MTDPTADVAKLLPCPSVICPSHHPAWDAGNVAGLRDETPGYRITCAECDASTGYYAHAGAAIAAWNTRPQPAPPEGEPDLEELAAAVHYAYLTEADKRGWPVKPELAGSYNSLSEDAKELDRATVRAIIDRLGRGARPKGEDAEVTEMANHLRATGNQYHQRIAERLERLAAERDAKGDYAEGMDALAEERLTRAETAEAKLSERKAELAKADAMYAKHIANPDGWRTTVEEAKIQSEILTRHAARQQPVKENGE